MRLGRTLPPFSSSGGSAELFAGIGVFFNILVEMGTKLRDQRCETVQPC